MLMGSLVVLSGWVFGVLNWIAAKRIEERKGSTFVQVIAAFNLLFQPFGLILGVFTLIVLNRPTVKDAFHVGSQSLPGGPTGP